MLPEVGHLCEHYVAEYTGVRGLRPRHLHLQPRNVCHERAALGRAERHPQHRDLDGTSQQVAAPTLLWWHVAASVAPRSAQQVPAAWHRMELPGCWPSNLHDRRVPGVQSEPRRRDRAASRRPTGLTDQTLCSDLQQHGEDAAFQRGVEALGSGGVGVWRRAEGDAVQAPRLRQASDRLHLCRWCHLRQVPLALEALPPAG
mmetsp:Transcript_31214/g.70964  ORF Transcript_31214/g.70964 Transcript_31214/m.70964 type:complete len:201 (-) Transcript_31214:1295-1897(-)